MWSFYGIFKDKYYRMMRHWLLIFGAFSLVTCYTDEDLMKFSTADASSSLTIIIKRVHIVMDEDTDGKLSLDELKKLVTYFGNKRLNGEFKAIGGISYGKLLYELSRLSNNTATDVSLLDWKHSAVLRHVFKSVDRNSNYIVDNCDAKKLLKLIDQNDDSLLSKEEWLGFFHPDLMNLHARATELLGKTFCCG